MRAWGRIQEFGLLVTASKLFITSSSSKNQTTEIGLGFAHPIGVTLNDEYVGLT